MSLDKTYIHTYQRTCMYSDFVMQTVRSASRLLQYPQSWRSYPPFCVDESEAFAEVHQTKVENISQCAYAVGFLCCVLVRLYNIPSRWYTCAHIWLCIHVHSSHRYMFTYSRTYTHTCIHSHFHAHTHTHIHSWCLKEVVIFRDDKLLTLKQVFESLQLTAYDLSVDTLDVHVRVLHVRMQRHLLQPHRQCCVQYECESIHSIHHTDTTASSFWYIQLQVPLIAIISSHNPTPNSCSYS